MMMEFCRGGDVYGQWGFRGGVWSEVGGGFVV